MDPTPIRELLKKVNFDQPISPKSAIDFVVSGLTRHQLHFSNPAYLGLFNPHATTMGVAADALAAAFNCQLAAWRPNPFGVEVEQHLIRTFGGLFGYEREACHGTFASGGSEANHTALICALAHRFPDFTKTGLRSLSSQPLIYVSSETHHSVHKSAIACGLGLESVREVAVGHALEIDVAALRAQILKDRAAGFLPLMVVGTAGTTSSGAIDPIEDIGVLAKEEALWFHLDAAYGGAAAILPELGEKFKGAGFADSVTFDAHKWLSVPMGAGIFLTRHAGVLESAFQIHSSYMNRSTGHLDVIDPHMQSLQWSRRFTGMKVFLSLAVAGWEGYRESLRHQIAMAELLRARLSESNWEVVTNSPLPIVCFVDAKNPGGGEAEHLRAIAARVVAGRETWISTTNIPPGRTVLRAGVVNFKTEPEHVELLVRKLNEAREVRA